MLMISIETIKRNLKSNEVYHFCSDCIDRLKQRMKKKLLAYIFGVIKQNNSGKSWPQNMPNLIFFTSTVRVFIFFLSSDLHELFVRIQFCTNVAIQNNCESIKCVRCKSFQVVKMFFLSVVLFFSSELFRFLRIKTDCKRKS